MFQKVISALILVSLSLGSYAVYGYQEVCQLVADKAGASYQPKPGRFATTFAPEDLPSSLSVSLLERNGIWFIYQAKSRVFEKKGCAPKVLSNVPIKPVLFNRESGINAVVNGVFLIQTYQAKDLNTLAKKYGFKKVTQLPNRFTAIFDTNPQPSYDSLVQILKKDANIAKLVPLLSEPRYQAR